MSGADRDYIPMFSWTNLFLAILRLNNKVIFNPTKHKKLCKYLTWKPGHWVKENIIGKLYYPMYNLRHKQECFIRYKDRLLEFVSHPQSLRQIGLLCTRRNSTNDLRSKCQTVYYTAICIQAQTANIFARFFTFETRRLPAQLSCFGATVMFWCASVHVSIFPSPW
jgi:hypothetical protein